jgi:isopentenyl-diphosphate delta-isomerase
VLHLPDRDETYDEAGARSLKDEMGITGVKLTNIGGFNYFAKYQGQCENEYCAVLVGNYDGEVTPNEEVVYEYKWQPESEFFTDVSKSPDKYTPWAVEAVNILSRAR